MLENIVYFSTSETSQYGRDLPTMDNVPEPKVLGGLPMENLKFLGG